MVGVPVRTRDWTRSVHADQVSGTCLTNTTMFMT
jgi:hypothetical protein